MNHNVKVDPGPKRDIEVSAAAASEKEKKKKGGVGGMDTTKQQEKNKTEKQRKVFTEEITKPACLRELQACKALLSAKALSDPLLSSLLQK